MKNYMSVILACVTVLITTTILVLAYHNRHRADDLLIVTGMAAQEFDSDLIVWRGSFERTDMDLHAADVLLRRDTELVKEFIKKQGMKVEDFVFSAVSIEKIYDDVVDPKGYRKRIFLGHRLRKEMKIESKNIATVEQFSRVVTDLLESRIEFTSGAPEYYYTQLGKLKLEMVAAATKDGRSRAEKIIENAAGKLGGLRYSSVGVFQITAPNTNTNPSWSGQFDTSSFKKVAAVTIKLQFGLN
jgi:uncharacterized protein